MSERAMSMVCCGRPYIKSRFTLSKLARAASTPRRASAAEWIRPSAVSIASSKLCTPSEIRLMPAARKPRKRAASTVPGLASSVICGMQELEQSFQGERTMADAVFLRRRQFGRCFAIGKQEDRVVAEAIGAARRSRDLAAPDAFGDQRAGIIGTAYEHHEAAVI